MAKEAEAAAGVVVVEVERTEEGSQGKCGWASAGEREPGVSCETLTASVSRLPAHKQHWESERQAELAELGAAVCKPVLVAQKQSPTFFTNRGIDVCVPQHIISAAVFI